MAAAVEEQGTATREYSRNVQQAVQGRQEVTSNISHVDAAASTGATASQALGAAGALTINSARYIRLPLAGADAKAVP